MNMQSGLINQRRAPALLLAVLVCFACGDDDNGPDDEQTGTVLQGTVVEFQAQVVPGAFALAANEGVNVSIGSRSTQTDANGNFTLRDFAVGNQDVDFSRDGGGGTLVLTDVESGRRVRLPVLDQWRERLDAAHRHVDGHGGFHGSEQPGPGGADHDHRAERHRGDRNRQHRTPRQYVMEYYG